ncbi:TonB-dependent receptor [Acidicapsa ligni]|uniref:TonB-dependent receptor n=1 Tax=Acidicapsa ligni TaxID=542300 RepID=UPI0021DFCAF6|nr:carboxypeptidase-like regulatory domain-containing protein [Acidicapsa ligni]
MRLARFKFLIVPMFLLFACVAAMAQQNSEIVGTVTDQTGAAVPDAKLVLRQTETGFVYNNVSNGSGGFVFPGLNIGTYTLKVTAKGFQTSTTNGLILNVSQTLGADVKLTIGSETTEVSVTADALAVQVDSNTVDTLISGDQVTEIATENRSIQALAALGLGVSSNLPDNNTPTSVASSSSITVNGLRQSHNIWLIDGGEADDRGSAGGPDIQPSADAIAQFQVLASNYPPDYGISSGATISLALKSGTQKFHGTLWELNRNDIFDANNFFNKYQKASPEDYSPVPKLRENIYGGNVGGPIFIPHVYNTQRQKTFFFWNEEWRKIIQGSQPTTANTIPDADRPVAGQNLTYVAPKFAPTQTIFAPAVSDPAYTAKEIALGLTPGQPMTTIPYQLLDPNAILYFGASDPVVPKEGNTKGQSVSSTTNPIDVREDVVRIDHSVNDKWKILGHYIHDSVTQGYPDATLGWNYESYNTVTSTLSNPSNSAAIKMTATVTPNLLVEASINYDGNTINITNAPNALQPAGWNVNKLFANGSKNLPGAQWDGVYGTGEQMGYAPWHNAAADYDPKVDISYTKGRHALKFGYGYNRYTKGQQLQIDPGGDYQFSHIQSGDAFISQILGLASQYTEAQGIPARHWVNETNSVYASDNWKVSSRLQVQIGFRYDALPHAWERARQVSNFDPNTYLPGQAAVFNPDNSISATSPGVYIPAGGTQAFYLNGMQLTGQQGFPRGLVNNDYATFQPRVGFSYDMTGAGRTVLRGGFGTFYERLQGNDVYGAATNVPFAYNPTVGQVYYSDPHTSWATGNSLSSTDLPVLASGITSLALTYKAPAVAQFSLGIQHQLAPSVIWVNQYVGNLAWHQNIDRNINTFPLTTPNNIRLASVNGSLTNPGLANAYRTYTGYGGISQEENTTNANYHSFQSGLRLQNKWGLSGELDYTYSHQIDLASTDLQTANNPWNLKYDKSSDAGTSGGYDRRHMFSANYIYKLPFFGKSTGLLRTTLGGWEVAGTIIAESGVPFIPATSATDTVGLGGGYTARPNIIGKMHYTKKVTQWFDPSVFQDATPGYAGGPNLGFGNAGRDAIVGPRRVNFNTSLYKNFPVGEWSHIQLRAESFNTFNHTEFNNLNPQLGNGQFGQLTGTWDPRVLQFTGKFIF